MVDAEVTPLISHPAAKGKQEQPWIVNFAVMTGVLQRGGVSARQRRINWYPKITTEPART